MKERKPIRLSKWDYSSQYAYHVVFCTKRKENLLSRIESNGYETRVILSDIGQNLDSVIKLVLIENPFLDITEYAIMPNHVHLLIKLNSDEMNINNIVGMIKARTTKLSRRENPGIELWQRGFYDHIIRNEYDWLRTLKYIADNPAKWCEDEYFQC